MTPNEFLLNRTYNKQYMKFQRDQSQFDNELCKEQLDSFVEGLGKEDPWALRSKIKVIVNFCLIKLINVFNLFNYSSV